MMDPYNIAICFGPTLVPIPTDRDQVGQPLSLWRIVFVFVFVYMPRTEIMLGNSSLCFFLFFCPRYLSQYFIFSSLQVQYQNLVNELIKNFIIFHEVNLNTHFFSNQYKLRWVCSLYTRICLTRSSDCLSPIGHLPERWWGNCLRKIHLQRAWCCRVSF